MLRINGSMREKCFNSFFHSRFDCEMIKSSMPGDRSRQIRVHPAAAALISSRDVLELTLIYNDNMSPPAAEQLIPERRRVVSVALCDGETAA